MILSWPAPQRNAPDDSVQSIRRIDVYRLAEKPGAPLTLTEEDFAARSTLIGSVTYEQINNVDTLTYVDTLELAGEPARLRYAIRYVNASNQRAAFSNFLLIEPAGRIAKPPTVDATTVKDIREGSVVISWQPPPTNIDGSTPVNLLGYNVYRIAESQKDTQQSLLNPTLISGEQYIDKNIAFGENYRYTVRSVSLGTGGTQVESLDSNSISVLPRDVFPPSAPGPVSIAPAPGRLSLFFPANAEPDIAGYNIYRSTDAGLPKERWTKLTPATITRTTFQDENVESGKRYYYYVTAIDQAGNVSPPSEVVSEVVP